MPVDAPMWTPTVDAVASAQLTRFRHDLQSRGMIDATVADAHALQQWSVAYPERFWAELWRAAGIMADGPGTPEAPWTEVLVGGERMAPPHPELGPRWFSDTRLNFAEHLLRRRDDGVAIVSWNEQGAQQRLTYHELALRVAATAAALRALGVGVGDRVVGYMPNVPEAVIVMLAATSIGAVDRKSVV